MNRARKITMRDERGVFVRFEIHTHDDHPTKDFYVKYFASGQKIKEAFHEWASQYGGATLEP